MGIDKSVSDISPPAFAAFDPPGSLQDDWEFELDLMGTNASIDVLERHLDKAPDPRSATAQFLKGFIASHAYTH